ncbi:MAG: N-acetylmuramoyl-L-alanine amidase family protein [Candidatus Heimdallarchaeaceae archaeon]
MNKIIVIDPGHGGSDQGALSKIYSESSIVLNLSLKISHCLIKLGWAPVLTRYLDTYIGLDNRVQIANKLNPRAFISAHCNGYPTPTANGFEIFTSPGNTKADSLATNIFNHFKSSYPYVNKRTDLSDSDPDKEASFFVLTKTKCPAVLIEYGFITNDEDRARLTSENDQWNMARSTATAIHFWTKEN